MISRFQVEHDSPQESTICGKNNTSINVREENGMKMALI